MLKKNVRLATADKESVDRNSMGCKSLVANQILFESDS
jgi:hypothetical protein